MPTITPSLWFNNNMEDALEFYGAIFGTANVRNVVRNGEQGPGPKGSMLSAEFELMGQRFIGLNGGPMFPFTEAVSFVISCESQAEVDRYWTALLAKGGVEQRCGWLKDRFGLSWQVIPRQLVELMTDKDPVRAGRVTEAMLKMKKIDLPKLQAAYKG
jgi:predicted 3-demethylubiquinone-9 3-methyltransferase (glyoxalase superfamily)